MPQAGIVQSLPIIVGNCSCISFASALQEISYYYFVCLTFSLGSGFYRYVLRPKHFVAMKKLRQHLSTGGSQTLVLAAH